jgi:hypothetical protein
MHNPVQNAAKPRSALLVHPYGHKVTGFKPDRRPESKEQFIRGSSLMKAPGDQNQFFGATIYLHEVEPRIQAISALNRFSTEPLLPIGCYGTIRPTALCNFLIGWEAGN